MIQEKWVIRNVRADFKALGAKFGLDQVTVRLMVNRGITTEEEMRRFLDGTAADEYEPSLMKGAARAAELLWEAVHAGEKILIASDFDVDGIFSGEILREGIEAGGGICEPRAPHRVKEGYGVNPDMVQKAYADGFTTMITCDNGIAAFDAVKEAKRLGMRVIVTDHHEVLRESEENGGGWRLPEADVIVNPHQPGDEYPFKGLCGAGVAYKVMELFFRQGGLPRERCEEFLEYAAIATVADVMDLIDENRIIVREGLRRLGTTRNPGLRALMTVCGLNPMHMTAYQIGFVIGPCFNSAGRLDTVDRAFRLLRTDAAEAELLAEELKTLNDERKMMTITGAEEACAWVDALPELPDVLVVPVPTCHESIVGIVAGRLRERYHHPVFVLTRGEDSWKGSGRSLENWDMFEHMLKCQDLLPRFGGHPMAAGLSIREEDIPEFTRRINEDTGLTPKDFVPIIRIDAAMPLGYITEELIGEFSRIEPFGKGNPKPVFAESRFRIRSARILGKNRNVLKMQVENEQGDRSEAMYFGDIQDFNDLVEEGYGSLAREKMYRGQESGVVLGFCYYPEVNEYQGIRSLQIVVTHVRLPGRQT